LNPEQWGSLPVQEKYQEEKACDKRHPYRIIIIIIIIAITTTITTTNKIKIKISRFYFCAEVDLYFNIFPLFCTESFYIALFTQNIFTKLMTIPR